MPIRRPCRPGRPTRPRQRTATSTLSHRFAPPCRPVAAPRCADAVGSKRRIGRTRSVGAASRPDRRSGGRGTRPPPARRPSCARPRSAPRDSPGAAPRPRPAVRRQRGDRRLVLIDRLAQDLGAENEVAHALNYKSAQEIELLEQPGEHQRAGAPAGRRRARRRTRRSWCSLAGRVFRVGREFDHLAHRGIVAPALGQRPRQRPAPDPRGSKPLGERRSHGQSRISSATTGPIAGERSIGKSPPGRARTRCEHIRVSRAFALG